MTNDLDYCDNRWEFGMLVIQERGDTSCLSMDSIISLAFYVIIIIIIIIIIMYNKTLLFLSISCC